MLIDFLAFPLFTSLISTILASFLIFVLDEENTLLGITLDLLITFPAECMSFIYFSITSLPRTFPNRFLIRIKIYMTGLAPFSLLRTLALSIFTLFQFHKAACSTVTCVDFLTLLAFPLVSGCSLLNLNIHLHICELFISVGAELN